MITRYLNEKEVAMMTGLSLSKLRQDRHKCRGLPYHKIGEKSVRYNTNDIQRFMEECRIEHNQKNGEKNKKQTYNA